MGPGSRAAGPCAWPVRARTQGQHWGGISWPVLQPDVFHQTKDLADMVLRQSNGPGVLIIFKSLTFSSMSMVFP